MDKLKLIVFSIIVLILLGLLGYWAVTSIQSGTEHSTSQRISELKKENEELKNEVESLTSKLGTLEAETEVVVPEIVTPEPETVTPKPPTNPTTYKNQTLINELQKLIDDNVFMKLKSIGTRVGTVQKFLNIYNNTSNRVDNDYGAGTVKLVTAFQKDQGLTADGEAGPGTFKKMIDWLKKQG